MKRLLSLVVILGFTNILLFSSSIGNKRNETPNLERSTTLSLKMSQCVNTTSTITETVCSSYTAPDGVVYTTSGVKTAIIPNAGGCDSIITINLTIDQPPVISGSISTTVMICTPPAAGTSVTSLEGMGLVISDDYTLNANLIVTSNDVSSGFCPTTITRTYTIKDGCNHQSTAIHTIYLADNIAPSITGTISTSNTIGCTNADIPIAANSVAALESMGLAISDNCTSDANIIVTSSDFSSGTCPITVTRVYTITDGCGNASTIVQTITVDDTISPTITYFPTTQTFCSSPTGIYSIPQMTATDNCVAPLSYSYSISGATSRSGVGKDASGTFNVGASTITWSITDGCGNISTVTTNVIINGTVTSTTNTSICLTELPYFWNSLTCGAAGPYTATLVSSKGCDSLATLNLTVNSTVTSTTNRTICATELPIIWNGLTCGAAGSYIATLVSSKGCDSLATLNLTVTPAINSVFTILDSICSGATPPILPTTSNNGITGVWSPSVVSNTTTGSYSFTPTAGQCANNTPIIVVVKVNQVPSVASMNVHSNSPICEGTTLNLYANGGVDYEWSGPAPYAVTFQNPTRANATVAMSGNYFVTITTVAGCSSTAMIPVVVNSRPNATIAYSGSPYCNSLVTAQSVTLIETTGGIFTSGAGLSINTTTGAITPSMSTPGYYMVTYTIPASGGCAVVSATAIISITQAPTATVNNNGPLCIGSTLNLVSSGGTGYSWSGPNGYTSIDQNPTISTVTATNAGIYQVTVTGTGGCTSTAQTAVVINALPTATANNNGPICVGTNLNLSSGGGTGYSWSGPNVYTSITQNPIISSVTTSNAGVYRVTVTGTSGCTSTAQTTVVVNPTVTSTTNIAISSTELPYLWNGLTFLTTGSQTATLVSSTGCDSLVTLNLTVNGQFVQIDRILVDACIEASGNEGENEMVLFHVESLPVNVSDIRVDGASGTGVFETSKWPNTANTFLGWIVPGTAAYDSASTKVAIINAGIANCGKLIIPTGGPNNQGIIPAGKKGLIITSSKFSTTAHDFSTLTDTLYVVIQNPGNVSGHFPNYTSITTSKFRSLRLHKIIADTIQINEDVTFDRNLLTDLSEAQTAADGASVRFTENGTATYYNNGCQAPYIPLNPAWNSTSVCQSAAAINLNALLDENATTGGIWTGIGVSGNTFIPSGLSGYFSVTYTVESSSCVMAETHAIQVIPNEGSTTNMTLCPLELPYMWNGLTFLVAGSQTATLVSSRGCDSLATLNLTVTPTMYTPIFTILDSICTGTTPPILPTTSNNGITGTWSPSVVSNTATGTYVFTPSAGQCADNAIITKVVHVNQGPTVSEMNVHSNSPVCVGTTLNLYASGGVNYAWSGPNTYATVIQNIVIPNAQVHFSGNYIVTVTTAEGCSSTATAIVVVNPLPTPAAFNNGPLCEGSTLNLTATGGLNYAWSGPNGFSSILQNPTITNITTANSGNYTVTVSNSGGCNSSTQTNVVINQSVSSTTDIAICSSALPFIWNGLTFATAGSQMATLTSIAGCDSLATLNLTVNTSSITGSVVYSGGTLNAGTASVILFNEDVSGNFQQIDSVIVGSNGSFAFQNMPDGNYHLYVNLTDNSTYPDLFNTYLDSTIGWQNAAVLGINCNTDTNVLIHMVETDPASPGNGHINGTIQQYTNNKTIGDPLPGVAIYVRTESNNEPIANCASKSNGVYEFTKIPIGIYSIYVDIPGIPMIQTYTGINVTASDTLFENLNFYVDTTTLSAGIYTDEILSVSKIETPELSVNIFPNPVKNELSIEVSNQTEGLSIEVLDINGKSLYKSTTGNRAKIEMNAFATGVYLIKIQSKNTVIFKKIIKE